MFLSGWRMGLHLVAVLLLASTSVALAQNDNVDPKAVELGAELVDLAGSKKIMSQMLDQMGPMLTDLVEKANPGKEADVNDVMNRYVLPKMAESLPELEHESAMLYARHFSTDELGQLVAFYQSPIGRKLVAELPGMLKEMSAFAQVEGQKIALGALKAYADEFRKRGLQTPI
jgi:hypothetical protein